MDQKYWLLIILWVFYYASHSLAASESVKRIFYDLGMGRTMYRKLYVLFSVLGLLVMLFFGATLSEGYILSSPGPILKYLSLVLAASGTLVIRAAFKQYNLREFLGIYKENPSGKLATKGILGYVRHPTYSGTILVIAGYFLFAPRVSSLIVMVLSYMYLAVGIYFEEKKLILEFGEHYINYKKNVPALIPSFKVLWSF